MTLLKNTQGTVSNFYLDHSQNGGVRKMVILISLGASLHMVQDSYSPSHWIHHDFVKLGFPIQKTPWGKESAPTWFEFAAKYLYPCTWRWPARLSCSQSYLTGKLRLCTDEAEKSIAVGVFPGGGFQCPL